MNLRHLHAFVSIVDFGGYAAASAHLNLSQPALSRQIQALEEEWGVKLFDRVGRHVELSADGAGLLQDCREILAHADAVVVLARALRAGKMGVLRVGATPNVIGTLLGHFVTGYQQRHPGWEVHLIEAGGAQLPDSLMRGGVHLAILPSYDSNFPGQPLFPMHLLAVMQDTHRLSRQASVDVTDLIGEPLLRLGRDFTPDRWLEPVCEVAHVRLRNLFESAVPQTIIDLARTGYGIAVLPSSVPILCDRVHVIPILCRGVSIGRWATAAWSAQRPLVPQASRFIEELADAVSVDFPGCEFVRDAPPIPRPTVILNKPTAGLDSEAELTAVGRR